MNAVKDMILDLVEKELAAANAKFPPFASVHEGYAVMLEEVEEAKDAANNLECHQNWLWEAIRRNNSGLAKFEAGEVERHAINLAAEAIQVAAMARKFLAIANKEG